MARTVVSPLRIHAALFTAVFLFSVNYIVSKLAMGAITPLTFAWLRAFGAMVILTATLPRSEIKLTRRDLWQLAGLSILGVVANQALFLTGLSMTSAHIAAILITLIPVFALAIGIALRRERGTVAKIGGIIIALAGALLVVGGEGFEGATKSLIGDLCIVANSLSYAFYLVLSKPLIQKLSARRMIARVFVFGTALMLPISAWSLAHENYGAIPLKAWLGLGLVIVGPTAGAYLLNAWALGHADMTLVAVYNYLQPVMTTGMAAAWLGERMRPSVLLAAALIFVGVWLAGRPVNAGTPAPSNEGE